MEKIKDAFEETLPEECESEFVPYEVVVAAVAGKPDAMELVLRYYDGYIASIATRKKYDELGEVYFGIDHEMQDEIRLALIKAIVSFKL